MKGLVFDIQRGSLTNGPGIRTTVFLKGCPLDCMWCHNPESKSFHVQMRPGCSKDTLMERLRALEQVTGTTDIKINGNFEMVLPREKSQCYFSSSNNAQATVPLIGRWMDAHEVMETVLRDKKYYQNGLGGLTVSGGEPFAQPGFLFALLEMAKTHKIHTCVDTSGFCKERDLRKSLNLTDLYLFDYKLSSPVAHKTYTGRDNGTILNNLAVLVQNGAQVLLRCPIVPGVNNTQEHLEGIEKTFKKNRGILGVQLMPYENYWLGKYPAFKPSPEVQGMVPMDTEEIREMEKRLEHRGVPIV